jgi:tRNA threonylcarbamoyl adenosine modification protein YjeE
MKRPPFQECVTNLAAPVVVLYYRCMKSYTSHSLEETKNIAAEWLKDISELYAKSDEAIVVGLSGHLGAGKTAFVKCVAQELGIKEVVTSPTFVIMKLYKVGTKSDFVQQLVHIDAYRLEKQTDLLALEFEHVVSDPKNLVLIEWPENVGLRSFKEKCHLTFDIKEGKHTIVVT